MDVEEAIRTRRTHKAYAPEPVDRATLEELFELARWAPNHHLTAPWRFRVIGPEALERLKEAAGPESAPKLDRAPTLVVCSARAQRRPDQDEEDLHATAVAAYIVLLAAHARGLAATGARPRCCGRRRAAPRSASPTTSASSACATRPPGQGSEPPGAAPAAGRGVPRVISRADAIEALTNDEFDVVVIGGGITGAGVALDAASRGYSVALVERGDYAQGTSSRSSKMVHGGLRYLQNFDLGLVREALLERQLMVQLAPHLVYPTPFLVPNLGEERRSRRLGAGLNLYDVMATTRVGQGREQAELKEEDDYWHPDRHRTISGEEAAEMIPALAPRDPAGAYLFYDCQTDDVRLVLTILGEAERFGAVLLNGAEVTEVIDEGGHAAGVVATEAESGEEIHVHAANVVNATGVWADRIRPDEILTEEEIPRISPSRGTHVTVSFDDLPIGRRPASSPPARTGRSSPCPGTGAPWSGRPTTTTTATSTRCQPGADDIDYLLEALNDFFGLSLGPAT